MQTRRTDDMMQSGISCQAANSSRVLETTSRTSGSRRRFLDFAERNPMLPIRLKPMIPSAEPGGAPASRSQLFSFPVYSLSAFISCEPIQP